MRSAAYKEEVVLQAMADELISRLSIEEHAVLQLYLSKIPEDQAARSLNVSVSTVYRRLNDIRKRIAAKFEE